MITSMTPDEFRTFLRELQEDAYLWPNDYLAWEKPDKTLFMVGICSTRMDHLLIHEAENTPPGASPEYSTRAYSIAPFASYFDKGKRYDPVEKLVEKVSDCRFLGSWHDPDVLMDNPRNYSKTLACGRWDLAKEHILQAAKKPTLNQQISQALGKVQDIQKDTLTPVHNSSQKDNPFKGRD